MLSTGDRVVVAVSGGADSVCLLDVLHQVAPELGLDLVVAHYNHGLRPAEDGPETAFVQGLARDMGLPCVPGLAKGLLEGKGSLEERARQARYAFLEEVRQRHGAQRVALGHTLDDQAETVLMRLLRGSGPTGLAGIPPKREPGIIRPLIDVRRKGVEAYLRSRGLTWRTDSSNMDSGFLRNRVRLELLPELLHYQPHLVEQLGDLAATLREEDLFLEGLADEWLATHGDNSSEGMLGLPRNPLLNAAPALRRRVIRRAIDKVAGGLRRMDRRHVEAVEGLAAGDRPQGRLDLPRGLVVRRSYERLVFGGKAPWEGRDFMVEIPGVGVYEIQEAGIRIDLQEKDCDSPRGMDPSPWKAYLDAEKLSFPLLLRPPRPGDRFVPLGMKGRRKLKDFFIDLKVPSEERPRVPLLVSGDAIAWVCGFRIDERFKVEDGTRRVMEVSVEFFDKAEIGIIQGK
jgi:tRNA(Ile)-lysidine synthase